MLYYVRDLLMNKLMTAYGAGDEDYPVVGAGPEGVLLHGRDGRTPTAFASEDAATRAIAATVQYGALYGYVSFQPEVYQVISDDMLEGEAQYEEQRKAKHKKGKK